MLNAAKKTSFWGFFELCLCLLAIALILMMAGANQRWNSATTNSVTRLDSLDQSRLAFKNVELIAERAIADQGAPSSALLTAELQRAQMFVRALRSGEGALLNMRGGALPSAPLTNALTRYEDALRRVESVLRMRLRAPSAVSHLDVRAANVSVNQAAVEVESLLLAELASSRRTQQYVDALNVLLATLLSCLCIVVLRRSQQRQKAILRDLETREGELSTLANAVPGLCFLMNREGRFEAVFSTDDALLVAPRASLIGRLSSEFLPSDLAQQVHALLAQCIDRNMPVQLEYPLQTPDGVMRRFEGRGHPIGDGRRLVWVSWEVTARWQAEQTNLELKRLYALQGSINQSIVWSKQREVLLRSICESAVRVGGFQLAWISWLDEAGANLVCRARSGDLDIDPLNLDESCADSADGLALQCMRSGVLLAQQALYVGETKDWRNAVTSAGPLVYRGVPLREQSSVCGVLNLLRPTNVDADEVELSLLRELGVDISHALGVLARESLQQKTVQRERLLAAALESCQDAVMITDFTGRIVSVNRAFTQITGYREDEAIDATPSLLGSGRHPPDFFREMWAQLAKNGAWQGEIWNRRKNRDEYAQLTSISTVRNAVDEGDHYVCVFSDVTYLKNTEAQLTQLAHFDTLTGLPNRALLSARLDQALSLARRQNACLAVLFIDLDNFKHVNDALGHVVGDELLVAVAGRIAGRLRKQDTIGRLGGDEFLLLLEGLNEPRDAAVIAQELLVALDESISLKSGHTLYVRISIGISIYPDDGDNAIALIRDADAAMYQAKRAGRATYRFYTEALTAAANYRLEMEKRLHAAFDQDEFRLVYQPLVSLADDCVIGVEALVRLHSPGLAPMGPASFLPLLEETGLIVKLGDWVMRSACSQGRRWLDEGRPAINIAINVSPMEMRRGEFDARLRSVLQETGFPPQHLEIELCESTLMEQGEHMWTCIESLRELGVRLSIDDFGTGYSSLAYLRRLPIDKIKIDASFIADIPANLADAKLVSAIIAMGRSLDIKVLAEGVENESQLMFLRGEGCDAYQGFSFSPPLSAEAFAEQYLARPISAEAEGETEG